MTFQTFEKDENNRGEINKKNLENEIRSVWQELVDNYRTFAADIECDIKRVRELLDETE